MFYLRLKTCVVWPLDREWLAMRGTWNRIPIAVRAIDGISHEINRPMNEPKWFSWSSKRCPAVSYVTSDRHSFTIS
jgi:hypothetical protein